LLNQVFKVVLYDLNETILDKAKNIIDKNLSKAVETNRITDVQKNETTNNLTFTNDFSLLKSRYHY
jgi:3-hydroxyacyl-CoA dehydrogenase